jgi:hypothetical protein
MESAVLVTRLYGFYVAALGLLLTLAPALFCDLLNSTSLNIFKSHHIETNCGDYVFVRVVGILLLCVSRYFELGSRERSLPILRQTAYNRLFIFASFVSFVYFGYMPPSMILTVISDLISAVLTLHYAALAEGTPSPFLQIESLPLLSMSLTATSCSVHALLSIILLSSKCIASSPCTLRSITLSRPASDSRHFLPTISSSR